MMKLDTRGKDAGADEDLALTPFDLTPVERKPTASGGDPSASVVLYRNRATEAWQGSDPAAVGPEPADPEPVARVPDEKGGWTVALLCAGIALIAVCLVLPLAEENHQLAYQREKLSADLAQIKQQVEVNGEFLKKVADDPTLAERLAERQMKFVREGTTVLDSPGDTKSASSPFLLVSLPPPTPMPAYRPLGGVLSIIGRVPRLRLYVLGTGLLLLAAGVILGGGSKETFEDAATDD